MNATPNQITVRMYRQGLGDCFLLALPPEDPEAPPFFMLIDCGLFYRSSREEEKLLEVVSDINETTAGHLNLLVLTHEHYDHLSGFRHDTTRAIWEAMTIDRVWAAWTEDPRDDLARTLRGSRARMQQALGIAAQRLQAADKESSAFFLNSLLGFSDRVRGDLEFALGLGRKRDFLQPGDGPLVPDGTAGVQIYTLGPPKNENLKEYLRRSDPSAVNSEVYEHQDAAQPLGFGGPYEELTSSLLAMSTGQERAELGITRDDIALAKRNLRDSLPFDHSFTIPLKEARKRVKKNQFYKDYYGFAPSDRGVAEDNWRRIENDWLADAEAMALQLDGHVNNTSLALAIEIKATGHVLIFPGDAQVGNLLSWHQYQWSSNDKTISMADLFRRTIFYKVGHHCSHNATLREKGLELMTHEDLVAFIPVSKETAAKKGRKQPDGTASGWQMPFAPLYQALLERTKHRVIQSDDGIPSRKPADAEAEIWKEFKKKVRQTDLYVEIDLA